MEAVFEHRPNLHADFRSFYALFWDRCLIDPVLLELCRLHVARLLGCRSELAIRYRPAVDAGLEEARIGALERWRSAPEFSELERACLAFAEKFVRDPHGIGDADAAAVSRELGDAGMVAFVEALAIFDGFARFRVMLGVEPAGDGVTVVDAPGAGALY